MTIKLSGLAIGLAMAGLSIFAGCSRLAENGNPSRAIKGVLDLSYWDFEKDGPIELSGEYEFYWQQHLTPESFSRSSPPEISGFMPAPAFWKGHELNGVELPATGDATYRLIIFLNDSRPAKLALKIGIIGTAYTAFVNGEKIASVGAAGQTPETTVPRYFPQAVDFAPASNRLELVYLVSNFHHIRGGAWEPIRLGTVEQINKIRERRLGLDLILFGSILIMGLYHLALFNLRKKDWSLFFFGVFCLLIAVRFLTIAERLLVHIFPAMSWELFVKIEYLAFCPAPAVFALFVYSVFSQDFHKPAIAAMAAVGLLFSSLVGVTPARIFTQTIFVFQLFVIACIVYALSMLVLCAIRKRESAGIFLMSFLFLSATTINDILYTNATIQTGFFVPWGLVIFIFSQAFMLSARYAKAFATIARQRVELEKSNIQYQSEVVERLQAKEALRRSEARYLVLYEDNPSMYFTVDAEGKVLSVNQFGAEQLGYTVAELAGQSVLNVFFEPDKPAGRQQLTTCLQKPRQLYNWELRKIRKDGSLLWVKEAARAINDAAGTPMVLIVCEDITERKKAEEALQQAHAELEQRVQERTAELSTANERLKQEIAERQQAEEVRERWRQRNLRAAAIVEAQENERRRFSRELHDGLGQILTGIKFSFETLAPAVGAEHAQTFAEIKEMLDNAIREGKRIVFNLMPRALDEFGIAPALELLCRQIS